MDPLSITASIIAILGTGGIIAKGFNKVRGLKDAPNILLQLNNEVSDLTLLVQAVDEIYRWHLSALALSSQEAVVCSTLERAQNVVLDLQKLIEYTSIRITSSDSRMKRTSWFGSLHRVNEMKIAIRAMRDELITVWAALNNR